MYFVLQYAIFVPFNQVKAPTTFRSRLLRYRYSTFMLDNRVIIMLFYGIHEQKSNGVQCRMYLRDTSFFQPSHNFVDDLRQKLQLDIASAVRTVFYKAR